MLKQVKTYTEIQLSSQTFQLGLYRSVIIPSNVITAYKEFLIIHQVSVLRIFFIINDEHICWETFKSTRCNDFNHSGVLFLKIMRLSRCCLMFRCRGNPGFTFHVLVMRRLKKKTSESVGKFKQRGFPHFVFFKNPLKGLEFIELSGTASNRKYFPLSKTFCLPRINNYC